MLKVTFRVVHRQQLVRIIQIWSFLRVPHDNNSCGHVIASIRNVCESRACLLQYGNGRFEICRIQDLEAPSSHFILDCSCGEALKSRKTP